MAEGVFGGLFGSGEDEAAEADAGEGRISAEAFAAALAEEHARHDPEVSQAAAQFLRDQSALLNTQRAEIEEQRPLRLRHLQNQSREGRLRRFGQRMRNGLQVFTAAVAGLIGLGVLIMIVDAFRAGSVVVEPFDAPPALAARGLTGKVVAGGVLDALTRLQAATRSSVVQRNLANAWTNDIKVEVPETGISIGDLDRMLRARFGHDTRIEGDLVQTATGDLALTIRGDGVLPKTFQGKEGDLDKLSTQAAEYVYGQSQPALYATYLMNAGRNAEAVAFAKGVYAATGAADRPFLLNVWADALQNVGAPVRDSAALYSEALRLKPDFWIAYNNLINVDALLGDEEGAWRLAQVMRRKAGGRPGRAPELLYQNVDVMTWNLLVWRAADVADLKSHAGVGTGVGADALTIADVDARLHDPAEAELQLQTQQGDASDPTVEASTSCTAAWRRRPATRPRPQARWKPSRPPSPTRSFPATTPATPVGLRRPKRLRAIRTRRTRCSRRRAATSTATASAATSSIIAATGPAPRRPTPGPSPSRRTCRPRTTPGAWRWPHVGT